MGFAKELILFEDIKIDSKRLDRNQYTVSLLQECLKNGIISSEEVLGIQVKIMDILKELIMKYTGGESTSVTVETTESLLNSLLYSLDFFLLKLGDSRRALKHLIQRDIKEIYEQGLELLRLCVIDTRKLYEKIRQDRLKITLEAYNATIDEAIPIFFGKYTVVFEAHNTMASIDYPLVFDDMKVRGISYIKNYLEHLNTETEFCRLFAEKDIKKTITGFERMCRLSHNIELINVFEILLNNSIFSVMCGNNPKQLEITKKQFNLLNKKLQEINKDEVNALMDKAVKKVISELKVKNPKLIKYINDYKELFKRRLQNALENNCMSTLIVNVGDKKENENISFAFDEGKRMKDRDFKKIIDKIMEQSEIEDKIHIINTAVHSLQDYMDILNSDCFFGDEHRLLFCELGDIELTILVKLVLYEELRGSDEELSVLISRKKDPGIEWQKYFIDFMETLDKEREDKIKELLHRVDYEEIKFN